MLEDNRRATVRVAEPAPAEATAPALAVERFATGCLDGPLAVAIAGLIALQFATWLPHYLTWPYWADHDVFATAGRAWLEGRLPYRDTLGNNFPGTIYLFVVLGQLFGWGRPEVWYAFDAGLILAVGLTLAWWSSRRFGSTLPGLAGFLGLTSYLFGLDYSHTAQRDSQGPLLAVLAVLLAQAGRGRAVGFAAGLLAASAFAIRPQTALFWPGLVATLRAESPSGRRLLDGMTGLATGLILLALPLVVAGVFDDLIRGVSLTAYGGTYNRATPVGILRNWLLQAAALRWWGLAAAALLLASPFAGRGPRTAPPWLWVALGVSLYRPISPVAHSYLEIPLNVVGAILGAVVVGLILEAPRVAGRYRLTAIGLVLGLGGATARPEFCVAGPTVRALAGFVGRTEAEPPAPPGYRRGSVPTSAFYPWADYRATLDHLRERTAPGTPVANALKGDPSINAMIDRPSPFPAESIAWLRMVRPADEARFARALENTPGAVVVWSPGEAGPVPAFRVDLLEAVIRAHFEPEVRFGVIEIWRRKAPPPRPSEGAAGSRPNDEESQ